MMFLTRGILILSVLFLFLGCQKNIQTVEILRPNWAEATLKATGSDKLPAGTDNAANRLRSLQRAKIDAYKNLREDVLNIRITDSKSLEEYIKDKDVMKGQVDEFIKRGKVTAVRYTAEESIEVDVELYLGKGFELIIKK